MSKASYRKLVKSINESCKAKTAALEIGGVYFLSSFYDTSGCMVEVVEKSTKTNSVGWASSVTVKILSVVSDGKDQHMTDYYQKRIGTTTTVNASNLYKNRADASHRAKFPMFYEGK